MRTADRFALKLGERHKGQGSAVIDVRARDAERPVGGLLLDNLQDMLRPGCPTGITMSPFGFNCAGEAARM